MLWPSVLFLSPILYPRCMARFLLALVGVVLLAITALALVWLLGQVLVGVGAFVVGAAGVLSRLLWFLVFTGFLAGLVYFFTSAWRPANRAAPSGLPQRVVAAPRAEAPEKPKVQPAQTEPAQAESVIAEPARVEPEKAEA